MKFKKSLTTLLLISTVVLSSWAILSAADDPKVIARAEKLYDTDKFEQSNKLLLPYVKSNPDSVDAYWMISRNYYEVGNLIPMTADRDKKMKMYLLAEEWARKGMKKNPGLADNTFFLAVGLGMQAQTNGVAKTIITNRKLVKQIEDAFINTTKAKEYHYKSELLNTIAAGHLGLGMFYRKIPDLALLKMITGTKGDLGKAIEHCRKGHEMFPNNHELAKELGISLICRGQKKKRPQDIAEGKKYLNMVIKMPIKRPSNRIEQKDAKMILNDLSLACGYSRVQQEEVTADKLKDK